MQVNIPFKIQLGGGNSNIFIFTPILGEDEPILTNISNGLKVETTNQL